MRVDDYRRVRPLRVEISPSRMLGLSQRGTVLQNRGAASNPWGAVSRNFRPLSLVLFLLIFAHESSLAGVRQPTEYEVKAAFLYNFAKFTQWPQDVFPDTASPILIGILGVDPFGSTLDAAIEGRSVAGRPIAVKRVRTAEEAQACHILFISRSERAKIALIIAALKDSPVLTISESDNAALHGVMINFVLDRNRVRFEINAKSAFRARLNLSSQLLRLAVNLNATGPEP